jgi:hypothetical protein
MKAEDEARKEAEARREEAERLARRAGIFPLLTMENFTLATALDFVGSVFFGENDWPLQDGNQVENDTYVAGSFLLGFEYAFPPFSAGFAMSGGFAEPLDIQYDFKSTNAVMGCQALSFKYRYCGEGEWKLCAGGSMVISADLEAVVNNGYTNTPPSEYWELNDLWENSAHAGGLRALQNPVYHLRQRSTLRPLGVFAASRENLFIQAELGFLLAFPVHNSDEWEERLGSSTGKWLLYALGLGYRVTDWLIPMAELRGLHMLNENNLSALMWLNLGVRFQVGGHLPMLRLSVPLTEKAAMGSDIQFALGITQEF